MRMSAQPMVTIKGRLARPLTKNVRGVARADATLPVRDLNEYYNTLFAAHGPQHWWSARTRFEIIVGAILTQNTSWKNVRRALLQLRKDGLLSPRAIDKVSHKTLARLIRSSGYFRQKAKKLKAFVHFLRTEYAGSLTKMFRTATPQLREQLLSVHGIGPETADAILLYAGKHAAFVVDGYARRILQRHALVDARASYDEIRALFERSIPRKAALYNEFHALIVHTGKHFCFAKEPRCAECSLRPFLPSSSVATP